MNLAPEFVIADRFRLISLIGQGGMGSVWLAHHLSLGVRCAVKFIHPEVARSPGLLARFEREAKAIAQIQGRHVVKVYDRGLWQDIPYIAMEYLVGEDLDKRLRRVSRLSPHETYTVLSDVCRALAKAHSLGLVHRDLKPGNIFLFQDDDREIAKVLDFGIAKDTNLAPDAVTKAGAILGTPYYMSPEQWRADPNVDARSDLWALGVIAFQCLTGVLPFRGNALGELFMKVLVDPVPIPSQVAPVPPGFDAWWEHAMQRDPALRFPSTKDAIAALGVALGIHPSTFPDVPSNGTPPSSGSPPESNPTPQEPSPAEEAGTLVLSPRSTSNGSPPAVGAEEDGEIPGVPKRRLWLGVVVGVVVATIVVGVVALVRPASTGGASKGRGSAPAPAVSAVASSAASSHVDGPPASAAPPAAAPLKTAETDPPPPPVVPAASHTASQPPASPRATPKKPTAPSTPAAGAEGMF